MKTFQKYKHLISLFFSSFIQVFLVACNTWQISKEFTFGAGFVGFLISYVWVYNIKRIAISNAVERYVYSSGASFGTMAGMNFAKFLYSI